MQHMALPGNSNTLRCDPSLVSTGRMRWPGQLPTGEQVINQVTETQLVRERRWPTLTVQLFAEPNCVAATQLPPPRQLRLIALLAGTMRMRVRSQGRELAYTSQPGTVKITSPHALPYEMDWQTLAPSPIRTAHLYLSADLLPRTAEAAGLNPARVELAEGCAIADPLLNQLTLDLAQQATDVAGPELLFAETAAQLVAAQLLRRHCAFPHELPTSRGPLPPERLRQLRDYVQAHLADPIRLEELAALAHLSPYHFSRVFKRSTGRSPYQYVVEQRVARAVELLRHAALNVTEVAAAVGYNSAAHLAQLLLRHTGRLPSSYRAERRA